MVAFTWPPTIKTSDDDDTPYPHTIFHCITPSETSNKQRKNKKQTQKIKFHKGPKHESEKTWTSNIAETGSAGLVGNESDALHLAVIVESDDSDVGVRVRGPGFLHLLNHLG